MRRLFRNLLGITGLIAGLFAGYYFLPTLKALGLEFTILQTIGLIVGFSAIGALVGWVIAPALISAVSVATSGVESRLTLLPPADIAAGVVGLMVGLLIAVLLAPTLSIIPIVGRFLPLAASIALGYLGMMVAWKRREDLLSVLPFARRVRDRKAVDSSVKPKLLDTSVIIDGRIADIARTGFLEGPILVPRFVLEELRHIADSSDTLKRNRGRRGLDILNRIQQEQTVGVEIDERDFDTSEVDSKLIRLAKDVSGKIITNDFNLNKVAQLEGVPVLNINELANSVKPVVLPGEDMAVHIIRDGKEAGQGVGYLDDGTMIVVDGGKKFIGETIGVSVTSVLQTAAGRMIFARLRQPDRVVSGHGGR